MLLPHPHASQTTGVTRGDLEAFADSSNSLLASAYPPGLAQTNGNAPVVRAAKNVAAATRPDGRRSNLLNLGGAGAGVSCSRQLDCTPGTFRAARLQFVLS